MLRKIKFVLSFLWNKKKNKTKKLKKNFNFVLFSFVLTFFLLFLNVAKSKAECGSFVNPLTDVGWTNLFPFKIAGITIIDSDLPDVPEPTDSPVCFCMEPVPRIGLVVSFWEPYRVVESVFNPLCFPSLGISLEGILPYKLFRGGITQGNLKEQESSYVAQAHFIISPFLFLLNLLRDVVCFTSGANSFNIGYMTEINPFWQDEVLSLLASPEALLFANPITDLACIGDSILSAFGRPNEVLFWCLGTWHSSVYPFTGRTGHETIIEGAATISARLLYKMHRDLRIWDANLDVCMDVPTPIWRKKHWRFQPLRPSALTSGSARIGQLPETWAYKTGLIKFKVKGLNNWAFLLWRKVTCCIGPPL